MAFRDIIQEAVTTFGIDISNADELAYLKQQINRAAKELYNASDLPGCLREQTFYCGNIVDYTQLSLPWYIDEVRAIRYTSVVGDTVALHDQRPRYHAGTGWTEPSVLRWRVVRSDVPLMRDLTNAAFLEFRLKQTQTSDVVIIITGQTNKHAKYAESVTIAATKTMNRTNEPFLDVAAIQLQDYCACDIDIYDINNVKVGELPAGQLKASNTVLHVRNSELDNQADVLNYRKAIDVLYKTKFVEMRNNYDEFVVSGMDNAIFWKFAANYTANKPGLEQRAVMAGAQSDKLVAEKHRNSESGKSMPLNFGKNQQYRVMDRF